ncbi:MAG TPA: YetF domain-containing protein [Sphingomicrobium sp.]|nr:YetF domain-containing protein [Sphingomicrobium sp.]
MTPWWFEYLAVVAVATGAYLWLIFVLRLTGKRTLAKLNAFDFAITVAFGSALATIIIDEHVGILRGALVLAMLALLQFAVTKGSQWSDFVRRIVRARPTLLVRDGMVYEKALKYERLTSNELAEIIRNNGFGRLADVGAVVLETDGSFSVLGGRFKDFDLLYDAQIIGEASSQPIGERIRKAGGSGSGTSNRSKRAHTP